MWLKDKQYVAHLINSIAQQEDEKEMLLRLAMHSKSDNEFLQKVRIWRHLKQPIITEVKKERKEVKVIEKDNDKLPAIFISALSKHQQDT